MRKPTSFFAVLIVALFGLGGSAWAESASITMNISNLKYSFNRPSGAQSPESYQLAGVSMNCHAVVKAKGETAGGDCSQSTGGDGKSTLFLQQTDSSHVLITMKIFKNDNPEISILHATLTDGNLNSVLVGGSAVFKITDDDLKAATGRLGVSGNGAKAQVKVSLQGEGKLILTGDEAIVAFPAVQLDMKIKAN